MSKINEISINLLYQINNKNNSNQFGIQGLRVDIVIKWGNL